MWCDEISYIIHIDRRHWIILHCREAASVVLRRKVKKREKKSRGVVVKAFFSSLLSSLFSIFFCSV